MNTLWARFYILSTKYKLEKTGTEGGELCRIEMLVNHNAFYIFYVILYGT